MLLHPEFEIEVSDKKIAAWIEETERRCPVTDNIQAAAHIKIGYKQSVSV